MKHLALSFFGTFQAAFGGKPLTHFRSTKVQGLLIYLVLTAQQAHDREVLGAFFWPEASETVAKRNLRQSLYRLRRLLGDTDSERRPFFLVTRSTVQLNTAGDYSLDVADFLTALERGELETAVSCYRDDLLPGFSCDSPPFDDWLRTERAWLHRQALDALYQLTTHSLSQADFPKAQRFARQQLALEPWREEAHRQLMQALASMGQRTAALAQYESCRTLLADELGIEPSAETAQLAQRIRADQRERPGAEQSSDRGGRQRLKIPFVGRQAEYETLVKAYRQTSHHGLQLVTVQGKAGIGKTRLTEQFVTWAATQGADVLYGRSFETGAGVSYQPIIHLLRRRVERQNAPEDLLSDLWLSQLSRLLPELRDRYPDLPEPTQEETTAKQHLFEAVTRLGQSLAARQPLVLFIDDWHWADAASLDLLHYAAVRWAEAKLPILLLLTLREEAVTAAPDVQSWLRRLHRDVGTTRINLSELSQPETESLIQALLAPAAAHEALPPGAAPTPLTDFSHWLFKETDGQPLFLTETLKALVEDGLVQPHAPTAAWQIDWSKFDEQAASGRILHGVREIIQGWLDRITPQASVLLTAVSVLAQASSFDNLCLVTGLDELQAVTALDELLNHQLLLETDERQTTARGPVYTFSHQKVSEVVYAEAGTARRRMLHRRAFEALRETAVPAAELAYHALDAGLVPQTIQYSLVAGNEAMALFAVRVAITHFETARQVAAQKGWPAEISGADQHALFGGLGRAYELVDAWTQARETYEAMIAAARTMGAAAMECLGLTRLATVYLNGLGDRPQAFALLEQAQALAEKSGDRRGVAEIEWTLSVAAVQEEKPSLALHHGERAVAIARELGHPQLLARSLTSLAQVYALRRQWEKAEPYIAESLQLYLAAGNLVLAANSQRGLGFVQIFLGHPAASLVTMQETFAFSQKIENLWGLMDCAWIMTRTHLELGHYGDAIRVGRQAVEQSRGVGPPIFHVLARSVWGIVQRTIMDWDAAQTTLSELFVQSPEEGVIGWTDQAPELCALYASVGEWEQAHAYARQIVRPRGDEPLLPFNLTGWYETEALLRGGDGSLARAEVARFAAVVGSNRRYQLPLLRSQAVLARWDGDPAQAIEYLQAALLLAQEIGLPGEAWPILGELGKLYGACGEQAQAQLAYQEAAAVIRHLAETIVEEDLRSGFLAANPVRSILELSEANKASL